MYYITPGLTQSQPDAFLFHTGLPGHVGDGQRGVELDVARAQGFSTWSAPRFLTKKWVKSKWQKLEKVGS
jgi:hypothetical protein